MARILILLAIVLGILWWLRDRAGTRQTRSRAQPDPRSDSRPDAAARGHDRPRGADDEMEPMVQCAHCGVHLPRGEAIGWQGLHYCRRSHLPEPTEPGGRA
ncbi:PP0621 family protein [Cupriavidus pampae]|uniref:MYND finger n=1 Tax=Cupriavidus pampae TaxID=659251 RepID=A0ABN7Z251_9BURK|nr:PP0621 family protein [Cupriavidus pampae]CAG9178466.1 hypothetical protein LMG32289_04052 [Cupriavidus pampae]